MGELHKDKEEMVSAQAGASAPERLHRWKDSVRQKHSILSAEKAERKRQEDDYFVAMRSRVMSIERVQLAAERNYEVAKEIERKKSQLRTVRERELLNEDECTFQPQLFLPARAKLARVRSRYRNGTSNATEERKDEQVGSKTKRRTVQAASHPTTAVFERLYARRKMTNHADEELLRDAEVSEGRNQVDEDKVAAFLERQAQFAKLKEARLAQLADETRCAFSPELSERTKQLSLERRAKPVSELLRDERLRRQRKLERCIGRSVSFGKSPSPTKRPQSITLNVFQAPEAFQALLLDLQAQEQRMKKLTLASPSRSTGDATGSPAGCAPPGACTPGRCSDSCGPASSARP